MWPAAKEAACTSTGTDGRPTRLDGRSAAEASSPDRGVLVQQMSVLRAAALAEVLHLHDLREHRYIDGRLRGLRVIVLLEHFIIL